MHTLAAVVAGAWSKFSRNVGVFDQWGCWWRAVRVRVCSHERRGEKAECHMKARCFAGESKLEEVHAEV